MKPLHLYDTYSRSLREFSAIHPPEVGMYTCGPTVYNYAHIGNLRTYIFADVLRRVLAFNGYKVKQVMNITDVGHLTSDADTGDDKLEARSRQTGQTAWEIAAYYTEEFQKDMRRLNILEPNVWCRATDHIQEQIDVIKIIEEKDFTYRTSDGIYFDTTRLPDYGHMGNIDPEALKAGSRVEMGEKRAPTDFALWKFSPADQKRQMEWDSPWGVGFPGWHIECSAMSAKYLGPLFDIHTGGEDHINIHHTNEIAQTEASYGTRLANFWMHGYFLQMDDNVKMSKSTGDFLRVQTLVDNHIDPLAYRFFCLSALYRTKLNFTWDGLDGAGKSLNRLRLAVNQAPDAGTLDEDYIDQFTDQINDDLNMPRAMAVVWDLVKSDLPASTIRATLLKMDEVLGLGLSDWKPTEVEIPAEVQALLEARQAARKEKRWQDADTLRSQITAAGYEIEDTPQGPRLKLRQAS